jgi:hypothetical protein
VRRVQPERKAKPEPMERAASPELRELRAQLASQVKRGATEQRAQPERKAKPEPIEQPVPRQARLDPMERQAQAEATSPKNT